MKRKSSIEIDNKTKFIIENDKGRIIFYISGILFAILTIMIFMSILDPFDNFISSFVIGIRSNLLTKIMINITNIGGAYSLIAISFLLLAIIKNKKKALLILINLICVFLTSQVFKLVLRRPRPDGVFLISASGFSYPSGHSMVSMAYIGFIIYLIYKDINNKVFKYILIIILGILAIFIGFSRVYLGVHYITDVIGGFLLAITYLMIFINIISNKRVKK